MRAPDEVARAERRLGELESLPDPAAREAALGAVQAVLELHGEGLRRILDRLGAAQAGLLAGDDLVGHLLVLHGLHPAPLEERVRAALDGVRPYLGSHGGDVELAGVEDGVVRLRLRGSCEGCPASAMTLKLAIEDAVLRAAPDVERVEAEGAAPAPEAAAPLLRLGASPAPAPTADPAWTVAGALPQLASGGTLVREVAGERLLFVAVDGARYAYRPRCPGCSADLEAAPLRGAELACPGCALRFDARRAGRCLDAPERQLEPVPLLVDEAGLVRVAVGAGVA